MAHETRLPEQSLEHPEYDESKHAEYEIEEAASEIASEVTSEITSELASDVTSETFVEGEAKNLNEGYFLEEQDEDLLSTILDTEDYHGENMDGDNFSAIVHSVALLTAAFAEHGRSTNLKLDNIQRMLIDTLKDRLNEREQRAPKKRGKRSRGAGPPAGPSSKRAKLPLGTRYES